MSIYKVVISFFKDQLNFFCERGAFAMTAGQALDSVISDLNIDLTRITGLRALVDKAESLETFQLDTLHMPASGSSAYSLKELWESRCHVA